MIWLYLQAWIVTVIIEVPVVALVFPGQRLRMACACLAATTVTHAFMHFALPTLVPSFTLWVVIGEATALAVEAVVYALVSKPRSASRALVASALANLLSFSAGLILLGGSSDPG